MAITQLYPFSLQCTPNSGRRETNLLADDSEGLTVGVELLSLLGQLGCQLLARAQGDPTTA